MCRGFPWRCRTCCSGRRWCSSCVGVLSGLAPNSEWTHRSSLLRERLVRRRRAYRAERRSSGHGSPVAGPRAHAPCAGWPVGGSHAPRRGPGRSGRRWCGSGNPASAGGALSPLSDLVPDGCSSTWKSAVRGHRRRPPPERADSWRVVSVAVSGVVRDRHSRAEECLGSLLIAGLAQVDIDQIAVAVDCPVQVLPLAGHPDPNTWHRKPGIFRAGIGVLGASAPKCQRRCCSMYCLTISKGAPPQDATK
jgi:hypothetical protein